MSWTDERVELLKKMWGEGQSASQIAKELGGVTRNAVIGKVHRLGLSNRCRADRHQAKAGQEAAKPTARPAAKPKAAAQDEPAKALRRKQDPVSAGAQAIIPAGQPLPPQPSANEISPEALAKVNESKRRPRRSA